jgi:hypothetical protein
MFHRHIIPDGQWRVRWAVPRGVPPPLGVMACRSHAGYHRGGKGWRDEGVGEGPIATPPWRRETYSVLLAMLSRSGCQARERDSVPTCSPERIQSSSQCLASSVYPLFFLEVIPTSFANLGGLQGICKKAREKPTAVSGGKSVRQNDIKSDFGEERRLDRACMQRGRGRLWCPDVPATALPQQSPTRRLPL